ncbi:MAG: chromosome segregation protein SMC [Deltaproteobacteria bacterium RBG_16_48_10]|nr:MAG: chromosome segregation protein SMC [Deltaproteobacteria bacterium RBG_16_48_10]
MAEVSLTFSNEDGFSPKGYEEYGEITVTRRFYRSGEGEYFINRIPCRLRDVTDLFLDTGIGVNGYSIVEQGRVDSLINANPQDRRFLIEEAAGIAKYKERKRLALMKMEAAQQNLLRIQDIIAEVKRQIVTLERQVKRAEEYKAVRKEIREIELRFALQEYGELSEKGESSRGYLRALREREVGLSAQVSQREVSMEGMRLKGLEEEEKLRSLQQEVFELSRRAQRLENEIEILRREKEGLEKQEVQWIDEVREAFCAWRGAHRERKKTEELRKTLEEEWQRSGIGLQEMESRFSELKARNQTLLNELEEEKGRLIDTLTQLTTFRNRLSHLEERKEDFQKRIRGHQLESEKTKTDLVQLEESLKKRIGEKELGQTLHSMLHEERTRLEGETEKLKGILHQKQSERFEKEERLRQDRSRYLSLKELQENFEGYEKGVKSILLRKKDDQNPWKGILGAVADILEPEARYEISLEAVLGPRLQALIVESAKEGMEAIDFLRRESLGRAHFIPREIRGKAIEGQTESAFSQQGGGEGNPPSLLRFVKVKEDFALLAAFLIGAIGVVESREEALHWMGRDGSFDTFVTLEGDIFERSGFMSGGSRDQGLGLLERRREMRELEGRIEEAEKGYQSALEEERLLQGEITSNGAVLDQRRKEIQEKEMELFHKERDLEQLGKEISQFQEKIEVVQFEGKQLEEEKEEIERERQEASVQMEIQEGVKKEREEALRFLKEQAEAMREGSEQLGREITEKKVSLASLEEKQKGIENQLSHLFETKRTLKEQILKRGKAIKEGKERNTFLLGKIDQCGRELGQILSDHRQREETVSGQKEKVEALSNEWKEAEASFKYLRHELEEIRQKIHEEEIRATEIQMRIQHLQESMRERYGTTLSPSIGTDAGEFPREEMGKRLEELKKALEGFGEVNLMALEEYQELKSRHDFLTEQQSDLQQALDALRKTILRINRTTTKRFLETFHLVNEKFKEVFTRLFKGGQASLNLLDEEDLATTGVDIIAQPPGKKLQNMDLLSGGEKALVAIALLFGLFMIRPTPFCLLDEVDAPLDDANIHRFIELVNDFSKTSQFIFITHNKKTMETANTLYGITMETPGVSKVVSVRLN